MAWHCSGRTNEQLIENLFKHGLITSSKVRDAMSKVDRAHFAPTTPYEDSPQSIGYRATISAPHMHASAAESLLPFLGPGNRVLDIGSGSGYLTAVLAELVFAQGGEGKVVGLEHIPELRDLGKGNLARSTRGGDLMGEGKVEFVLGDGRKGWVDGTGEGWDAIHVGAAAVELHQELVDQLNSPGRKRRASAETTTIRIFIPVEDPNGQGQYIWVVDKDSLGKVSKKRTLGVRYVPLTDAPSSR